MPGLRDHTGFIYLLFFHSRRPCCPCTSSSSLPQVRGRSLLFFLCSLPPFTFFFILSFRARNHDTVNSARMGGQVEGAAHLPGLCDHAGHSNHTGHFPYVAAITIKALCKLDRGHHHGGGPPSLFHFDCLVFLFSSFNFSRYLKMSVSLSLRLPSS